MKKVLVVAFVLAIAAAVGNRMTSPSAAVAAKDPVIDPVMRQLEASRHLRATD